MTLSETDPRTTCGNGTVCVSNDTHQCHLIRWGRKVHNSGKILKDSTFRLVQREDGLLETRDDGHRPLSRTPNVYPESPSQRTPGTPTHVFIHTYTRKTPYPPPRFGRTQRESPQTVGLSVGTETRQLTLVSSEPPRVDRHEIGLSLLRTTVPDLPPDVHHVRKSPRRSDPTPHRKDCDPCPPLYTRSARTNTDPHQ